MEVGAKCRFAVSTHIARIKGKVVLSLRGNVVLLFTVNFFIKLSQRDMFLPSYFLKHENYCKQYIKTISNMLLPL